MSLTSEQVSEYIGCQAEIICQTDEYRGEVKSISVSDGKLQITWVWLGMHVGRNEWEQVEEPATYEVDIIDSDIYQPGWNRLEVETPTEKVILLSRTDYDNINPGRMYPGL